jgi:hypothetical protein
MLMKCFRMFFFSIMCLLPSPMALAQASTVNSQTGLAASSPIAIQSGSAISKKSSSKFTRPKASSSVKSMQPSGTTPKVSSLLVFQPGVGWQHAPQVPVGSARSVIANSGTRADHGIATPLSGTSKGISGENSSSPSSGAAVEGSKSGKSTQRTGPSGSGAVNELAHRAYISPIELRRQMRNEPDLKTRIKLRRLNDKLTTKSAMHSESDQKKRDRKMIASGLDPNSMSPSELKLARRRSGSRDANARKGTHLHKSL